MWRCTACRLECTRGNSHVLIILKDFFIFSGYGDALLSCQVEQLKEELSQSQSEKEELRQRANELQQEAAAVREAPLCSRSRSFSSGSFLSPAAAGYCLTRLPVRPRV